MSVAQEITRIQTDRNSIRAKLIELGMAQSTDTLDDLAEAVQGIENRGAVSATVMEGDTFTIPQGYHNGSGTVSAVSGGGNYSLQSRTATPTKSQQNITPDSGYYGLSDVTVAAIPDIYQDVSSVNAAAGDVLAGKIIVDSAGSLTVGTMPNNGDVSKTLTTENPSYTIPKGYHSGEGTVDIIPETKSVTPSKAEQTVTPSEGKLLSGVTVDAIPENYLDTGDATAEASHILAGKSAYAGGVKLSGTMPDNGSVSADIDGLTVTSVTIPAGYTSGGTVSLTDAIETELAAI